jgi:hypothetical protein
MFDVGLKPFCGFYKKLEIDLTLFGCIMQDLRKKQENRNRKEERTKKNRKRLGGAISAQPPKRPRPSIASTRKGMRPPLSLTDTRARVVSHLQPSAVNHGRDRFLPAISPLQSE